VALLAGSSPCAFDPQPGFVPVAVKAGFLLEGIKRSAAVHSDGRHDMHLHARFRGSDQDATDSSQ
jgi:hypothetical protein